MRTILVLACAGALAVAGAGCGGDDTGDGATTGGGQGGARVVVTTNVLGDVVGQLVGADATVEVIMPVGSDPHDFAPSAKQAAAVREADVLVVNGGGLEVGLLDAIEGARADGVTVLTATAALPGSDDHDDDDGHDHDDDHDDHDGHSPSAHFFTDPVLMGAVVDHLGHELPEHVPALDTPAFRERVADYRAELHRLADEVAAAVATVPVERRLLVTNHDVFGAFAERFGFEVLGALIPGGSTLAEASAGRLHQLAQAVAEAGVPAVFTDASAPRRLAEALAAEGTDVAVVELFTELLGPAGSGADTYLAMVRTNAERIVGC